MANGLLITLNLFQNFEEYVYEYEWSRHCKNTLHIIKWMITGTSLDGDQIRFFKGLNILPTESVTIAVYSKVRIMV